MDEIIDNIRSSLDTWGKLIEVLLNVMSLLVIVIGAILSIIRSLRSVPQRPGPHPQHTFFRRMFGGWLIVALEFQLAADIVGTIISPTSEHLIELGGIAVIRTFLNYFLNIELKEESEMLRMAQEKTKD